MKIIRVYTDGSSGSNHLPNSGVGFVITVNGKIVDVGCDVTIYQHSFDIELHGMAHAIPHLLKIVEANAANIESIAFICDNNGVYKKFRKMFVKTNPTLSKLDHLIAVRYPQGKVERSMIRLVDVMSRWCYNTDIHPQLQHDIDKLRKMTERQWRNHIRRDVCDVSRMRINDQAVSKITGAIWNTMRGLAVGQERMKIPYIDRLDLIDADTALTQLLESRFQVD